MADMALGLFTDYAELGQRAFTKWRSLATDIFIQDSWRPTAEPDHRRRAPLRDLAAVVFDDQQHRQLRSAVLRSGDGGDHQPGDRPHHRRQPLQRHRPGGRRLQGRRERPRGRLRIPRCRRCSAASRAASRRRTTTSSSRASACRIRSNPKTILRASAGIFHNRVTLNDSTLLGGNPPFQPMVVVSNGSVDNPVAAAPAATDLPFGDPGAGRRVQASRRRTCGRRAFSARCRSASSSTSTYVGRRGLYLQRERNINQLLPGTIASNPGSEHRGAAALQGLRRSFACRRTPRARCTTACS